MRHGTRFKSGVFGPVDALYMSENERRRIKAYMQDGEFIAEVLCRALAGIQSAAESLARGSKAMFARPIRH